MAINSEKMAVLEKREVRPTGAGELAALLLEEREMSQTEAARRLGITRVHLNRFFNDKVAGLTPDMAHRLGRFFGNGAAFWLRLEHTRQMWDLMHGDDSAYQEIEPLREAA